MKTSSKIYVAGHSGLAGSAIVRALGARGYANILTRSHAELDLSDGVATKAFFQAERPDYVFLAAAKVGGILANKTRSGEFIHDNLAIQTNVIHQAWCAGVQRLVFLGSSCVYPRDAPQPLKEDYLLGGPLEITNRPYAVAKIAGIEMCWAYNRQYATKFLAAMPTNLYGPGDNYDLNGSHVLPALIRKIHEARQSGQRKVTVWGSGKPRREFLYSDDLGQACVFLINLPDVEFEAALGTGEQHPLINVGAGEDITVHQLAEKIARVVGFDGEIILDPAKPDGTFRKLMDISRLSNLGWKASIGLDDGLALTYRAFLAANAAPQGAV